MKIYPSPSAGFAIDDSDFRVPAYCIIEKDDVATRVGSHVSGVTARDH